MGDREFIQFDIDKFSEAFVSWSVDADEAIRLAIYSTMSKVRKHAVSRLSSEIRNVWNVKKKDLDRRIKVKAGSRGGRHYESFELTIRGTSISLSYFDAKQYAGSRTITRIKGQQNKRRSRFQGVSVKVRNDVGVKQIRGAWLQHLDSGHIAVMRRKGRGRYPVVVRAVVSPAHMFNDAAIADRFEEGLLDFIERTFAHELERQLRKAGF